jgi:uncharacterized membrane protein
MSLYYLISNIIAIIVLVVIAYQLNKKNNLIENLKYENDRCEKILQEHSVAIDVIKDRLRGIK